LKIELIASDSSALLSLLIQQVSTQKCSRPSRRVSAAQRKGLAMAQLDLAMALRDIPIGHLLLLRTPGMRQYGVWRTFVVFEFHKAEIDIVASSQKAHLCRERQAASSEAHGVQVVQAERLTEGDTECDTSCNEGRNNLQAKRQCQRRHTMGDKRIDPSIQVKYIVA
jgi:hypothetical protein